MNAGFHCGVTGLGMHPQAVSRRRQSYSPATKRVHVAADPLDPPLGARVPRPGLPSIPPRTSTPPTCRGYASPMATAATVVHGIIRKVDARHCAARRPTLRAAVLPARAPTRSADLVRTGTMRVVRHAGPDNPPARRAVRERFLVRTSPQVVAGVLRRPRHHDG